MWGHPNIIRKWQAGLQSEAPTQTAQVHISALLSPSQIPTSFQASIFTDVVPSSGIPGSLLSAPQWAH